MLLALVVFVIVLAFTLCGIAFHERVNVGNGTVHGRLLAHHEHIVRDGILLGHVDFDLVIALDVLDFGTPRSNDTVVKFGRHVHFFVNHVGAVGERVVMVPRQGRNDLGRLRGLFLVTRQTHLDERHLVMSRDAGITRLPIRWWDGDLDVECCLERLDGASAAVETKKREKKMKIRVRQ